MKDWREAWRKLRPEQHLDSDVREEIAFHIEERVREAMAQGEPEAQARERVLGEFGDVAAIHAACRRYDEQRVAARGRRWTMEGWKRDVRLAWRGVLSNPGYAGMIVFMLALGIGASTAVFSVVDGALLRPPPFTDPERLVQVWENDRATGTERELAAPADYYSFRERARTLASLAMFSQRSVVLTRDGTEPIQLEAAAVTSSLTEVLGIDLPLGRSFMEGETLPSGAPRVVLDHTFWTTQMGADPGVLGTLLQIDGRAYEVIGVLPADLSYPSTETDVWLPLQEDPLTSTRQSHYVGVVGRLTADATVETADTDLRRVMAELEAEYPESNVNRGALVEKLVDVGRGELKKTLWTLFAAVLVVLAIACVNVANLMLARGTNRSQELAVLTAVGADRRQLARKFITEGVTLTILGAASGILIALLGTRALVSLAPEGAFALGQPGVSGAVLAFTLLVATAISVLFGLLPIVQTRGLDLQRPLKESRLSVGRRGSALRRALVASQLALAVVLLLGASLLLRTLWNLQAVDPGFRSDHTLKADLALPPDRYLADFAVYPDWPVVLDLLARLEARAGSLPGATSAAVALSHPLDPGFTNSFRIDGQAYDPEQGEMSTRMVTPGYFATAGVDVREGRGLSWSDRTDTEPVLLLNERAARRYFPEGDALGSNISFWGQSRRVVGIVANELIHGLTADAPPAMYISLNQSPPQAGRLSLMIRTSGAPLALAGALRALVRELDPTIPVYNVTTMDAERAEAMGRERFATWVLSIFAGVALLLSLLGVYGVLSYLVSRRTREVGLRMALGASRRDVLGLILSEAGRMIALGVGGGLLAALAVSRGLSSLLYGVSPTEPLVYATVALILTVAAAVAATLPARRASRVDPARSLRAD